MYKSFLVFYIPGFLTRWVRGCVSVEQKKNDAPIVISVNLLVNKNKKKNDE